MPKVCSTCGQHYPDQFAGYDCRVCGGIIERNADLLTLSAKLWDYEARWQEWKEHYEATPPRPLTDDLWLRTCAHFNKCGVCGAPDISEHLLIIPPYLGGKLYYHNVIPACEICAKRVRQSQSTNPIKSFYTIQGADKRIVDHSLRYIESIMVTGIFEQFNFEEDSIEIIVKVTEDTSTKPFNGIFARRIFDDMQTRVDNRKTVFTKREETYGVTWRLLDE